MKTFFSTVSTFLIFSTLFFSCGDEFVTNSTATGTKGGACYANKTCNEGLECINNVCIDPDDPGDTGNTGDSGNTGDTGNSGNTGDSEYSDDDFYEETFIFEICTKFCENLETCGIDYYEKKDEEADCFSTCLMEAYETISANDSSEECVDLTENFFICVVNLSCNELEQYLEMEYESFEESEDYPCKIIREEMMMTCENGNYDEDDEDYEFEEYEYEEYPDEEFINK